MNGPGIVAVSAPSETTWEASRSIRVWESCAPLAGTVGDAMQAGYDPGHFFGYPQVMTYLQ